MPREYPPALRRAEIPPVAQGQVRAHQLTNRNGLGDAYKANTCREEACADAHPGVDRPGKFPARGETFPAGGRDS